MRTGHRARPHISPRAEAPTPRRLGQRPEPPGRGRLALSLGATGTRMPRTKIPDSTRELVLLEAGYKCANPTCRHILTLELHHIKWVKNGGGNDPANLLALCPNCHSLHTNGHIPVQAIHTWKSLLIALNS